MSTSRRRSKSVRQVTISVIAGLIVALIISLAGFIIHGLHPKSAAANPLETSPPTSVIDESPQPNPSPTATQPQTSSPSVQLSPTQPSSAQSPPPSSALALAEYLSDMTPLPNDTPYTTPQQMGGIYYTHSLSAPSGGCADDQQDTFSYVINRKFRSFQAIVGLNDQSLDDIPVEIEIDADGRILYSGTFTAGKIVDVKENIAGVRELDLEQTYVGPNPNICSSNVTAVWGNAEVLP
jgi:NPCBM/NEW2 domain